MTTENDGGAMGRTYAALYPAAIGGALAMLLLAAAWTALDEQARASGPITLGAGVVALVATAVLLAARRRRDAAGAVALQVVALLASAAVVGELGLWGAGAFVGAAWVVLAVVCVVGTALRADRPATAAHA